MLEKVAMKPIGIVHGPVNEVVDDVFGGVVSRIALDSSRFTAESLAGLSAFSHLEIVFLFDRVGESEIHSGARRPRGRDDWPLVGIFAQRGKNRPNRISVTICRIVGVEGLAVEVEGPGAI